MSVSPISQAPSILSPIALKAAQGPAIAADPDGDGDVDGAKGPDNDAAKGRVNIKA